MNNLIAEPLFKRKIGLKNSYAAVLYDIINTKYYISINVYFEGYTIPRYFHTKEEAIVVLNNVSEKHLEEIQFIIISNIEQEIIRRDLSDETIMKLNKLVVETGCSLQKHFEHRDLCAKIKMAYFN